MKDGTNQESKNAWLHELSGALGDLGTFLPYVLASVTAAGLSSTSVFAGFGLFYLFSGWFYGMPMAVQPMKAASAVILTEKISAPEVAAAGIVIGMILLLLGLSGLIARIARLTPDSVVGGIQLGLGVSLAVLGLKMVSTEPALGFGCLLLMLFLLFRYQSPAALIVLVIGTAGSLLMNGGVDIPAIKLGLHLPELIVPTLKDFGNGTLLLVLPQLPLTLTNAVLVTTVISRELFPQQAERASEKNLCLTMGGANLLLAPLGGYMMCHGSGGVAAHYRYGGRTAGTVYIIGILLLSFGLLLGDDAILLLGLIPKSVLGALLFYSGLDLAMATRSGSQRRDRFIILLTAAFTIGINPAIAFISGLLAEQAIRRSWVKVNQYPS